MQAKLTKLMNKLRNDDRGLSTVEYVVLLVLIVAIAVALWNVFGNSLTKKLAGAAKEFDQEVVTTSAGDKESDLDKGEAKVDEAWDKGSQ